MIRNPHLNPNVALSTKKKLFNFSEIQFVFGKSSKIVQKLSSVLQGHFCSRNGFFFNSMHMDNIINEILLTLERSVKFWHFFQV